jgi:transposase-like protein
LSQPLIDLHESVFGQFDASQFQDHRGIKSRIQPMLGFEKFSNARRVLIGIEFVHMVHKGQFDLTPT